VILLVMLLVVSSRGQIVVNARTWSWGPRGSNPNELRIQGQVGQESHPHPAVLEPAAVCTGTYTSTLEMGHFDRPKCQEVPQRSPALGSKLGSKQPEFLLSPGCHLEVPVSRT